MGVLLQGFYKTRPNNAVPSPADGNPSIPWWWDNLAAQAAMLRQAGFTAVWLPPLLKTASGAGKGADGYGPFDDYDIGSRHQKGSTPTRFGSREQLIRCVAVLRANGLDVYLDLVEHHRSGDTTPFVFRYPGADDSPDGGRFPKDRDDFIPNEPHDPDLGGPVADDKPFGREFAIINAQPPNTVLRGLTDAADWLTRTLDVQGYRIDDVKGLSTDFLRPFLTSEPMRGKFAVGEFFDGSRTLVNGWVNNPRGMKGVASAFDFPLKFVLTQMCNNPGNFNMADLDHVGLVGISPFQAVTFIENHDTDLNANEIVVLNKLFGYAYILTSEGYPCVYYRDYDMGPDGYKLKPQLDNLIWIHERLAAGPTQQRWKDFDVFAYERLGGPHLLVGLNNDPENPRLITVATGFGPNRALHDYTGHAPDAVTDNNGNVTITVPPNKGGLGYVCYSGDGQGGGFDVVTRPVTQVFQGAADLDLLPVSNGAMVKPGRIWCAAGTLVQARLDPDPVTAGWTNATSILLELLGPDKQVLAHQSFNLGNIANVSLNTNTRLPGFHTIQLTMSNAPEAHRTAAYKLTVTYTAPKTVDLVNDLVLERSAQPSNAAEAGQWSPVIPLANVPIHTHVLPTGKVLFWGRRNPPGTADFPSLNQHETHAFIWDPAHPQMAGTPTGNQPADAQGRPINLFCSGHTFLADGRLLVTGGHIFDSQGINCSTFYDCFTDRWSAGPVMNNGRWYPTAVTMADGRAFVISGSFASGPLQPPKNQNTNNNIPQVLQNGSWHNMTDFDTLPLFPRIHIGPDGSLFMSGTNQGTFALQQLAAGQPGTWVHISDRKAGNADYAPSVMYAPGKVVYIGGGGGDPASTTPPTNTVEVIDLNAARPVWTGAAAMGVGRRQHNATLLPDGTVLVTGGSRGVGFDRLDNKLPVHIAELWDPTTGKWTQMVAEDVDRCYHSTAVLLPDGRVFSGGGGEYAPKVGVDQGNPPSDTHANAQLFSPPYLFKGARPVIGKAPQAVSYGSTFDVETQSAAEIAQVTLLRLSSVTHSFNMNQRINFLVFQHGANKLTVTAPPNSNVCPPGHYMLFLLNAQKVPSVATIVSVGPVVAQQPVGAHFATLAQSTPGHLVATALPTPVLAGPAPSLAEKDAAIRKVESTPPISVGITAGCVYGISGCRAGAMEALSKMTGVRQHLNLPDADNSLGFVWLQQDGLPDLDAWAAEFAATANGTNRFRGVEVTESGLVSLVESGYIVLQADGARPTLPLVPMVAAHKIQYDDTKGRPKPLLPKEKTAWQDLENDVRNASGSLKAWITGPLRKSGDDYLLEVRVFSTTAPLPAVTADAAPASAMPSCCSHKEAGNE